MSVCTCTKANGRGVFVFGSGVGAFVCQVCADRLTAPARHAAALAAARDEVVRAAVAEMGEHQRRAEIGTDCACPLCAAVWNLARLEKP